MPESDLSGVDKTAVFLMSLGETTAAEVLRHLGPREVQRIGSAMAAMENISRDMVQGAITDFVDSVKQHTGLGIGSAEYIRRMLTDALGQEKASSMIDRILMGGSSKGLEALKWMDARAVVELIRQEHPQIVAIVLSYLDSDQSAAVLAEFPAEARAEILMRIATLDGVQPQAMMELNEILEKQLRGGSNAKSSTIGGVKAAADILNYIDRGIEATVMEEMSEADAELADTITDLMFVFDDLVNIDDRAMQTLLRDVSTDQLVIALKGTDEAVQEKVYANMSQRAADMLRDDLEAKGPVKLSEVETAQKEVLAIARRLADEGQLSLGGAGGDDMV
ncbi:MAG: flagellar motor switch protein FliG [Gammaproteobacteria bacterium]|nr:flagellar motor switch protein FliG [Gammaproteobacteria bacterium]